MIPNAFAETVPAWVKNTAGWWATDAISETEFVNAIAYLIKAGIISIESSKSPELIAEMWASGDINDDKFLANIEQLIEKDIITIQKLEQTHIEQTHKNQKKHQRVTCTNRTVACLKQKHRKLSPNKSSA